MAYDLDRYASLGLLWESLAVDAIETPQGDDRARVQACLEQAQADIRSGGTDLRGRLGAANRAASQRVRELLRAQCKREEPPMPAIDCQPQAHDLLWGMHPAQLDAGAPDWARAVLAAGQPVVVRRGSAPTGQVAVGVRGRGREQRYATWMRRRPAALLSPMLP